MTAWGRREPVDLLVVSHPSVVAVNQEVYLELQKRGWRLAIAVPDRWRHPYHDGDFAPRALPGLEDALLPLPVLLPGHPLRHVYPTRTVAMLRSLRPRVLFVEADPFALASLQWAWAASRAGVPFGVQADENLDRPMPKPVTRYRRFVLEKASFVACRSPSARRLVTKWGAAGLLDVIPHAVPGWEVARRSGDDRFTVGFAGRLVPQKGLHDLVAAVERMRHPSRLLVVGDGPLRAELEAVGPRVEVVHDLAHERMPEAYGRMDVLVLPSRSTPTWCEQFGRVLVEALWCGVPVVGSDSGEIPWVVETTGGGVVVPEGDPVALAATLDELAGDRERRLELATHGRLAVQRLFSAEAVAERFDELLKKTATAPI